MKTVIGCCLFFGLIFLFACSKTPCDPNVKTDISEFKDQSLTFEMSQCQSFVFGIDNLQLCLDSVADSRCPANANCIWGGTAITKFSFTKNGHVFSVNLATPSFASYAGQTSVSGYTFKLINVSPYPELDTSVPANEKKVKIEIRNY